MNDFSATGRLLANPHVSRMKNEKRTEVSRFTLIVKRRGKPYKNTPRADFLQCETYGYMAVYMNKYGKKGALVEGIGELRSEAWTDKEEKTHYRIYVFFNVYIQVIMDPPARTDSEGDLEDEPVYDTIDDQDLDL